jgi:hypothetical protein
MEYELLRYEPFWPKARCPSCSRERRRTGCPVGFVSAGLDNPRQLGERLAFS